MKQADNLAELGKRLKVSELLNDRIKTAEKKNQWFIERFVRKAIDALINDMLDEKKLADWLKAYDVKEVKKTIGLIFAGNIPLAGFHDFLCCYITGAKMKIKLSLKDDVLFPFILNLLSEIDPEVKNKIDLVDTLKHFEAVIATGSDNTNRYFEYYFRNYPKILRKNRNSVAVLTGGETAEDLEKLADDIFLYFGLGCRNVSKLYLPAGYDIRQLFPHFEKNYKWLHEHNKYMGNYDYYRTILLLNNAPHMANEFVMLEENTSVSSPVASLHYEYWNDENELLSNLKINAEKIQCIAVKQPEMWTMPSINFGQSQHPLLSDYADSIDTVKFLMKL